MSCIEKDRGRGGENEGEEERLRRLGRKEA